MQETQAEVNIVQTIDCGDVPKYFEFAPDAVWHKKRNNKDVQCSYLVMENVQGVELIDFFNNALQHNM